MWDWYGPYAEVISRGAFTKTLSETPDVALLLNHKGMTLARTKSGTLELAEDDTGLHTIARVDTRVSAVSDMVLQMERGDLDEMSFAFMIVRGKWSPDYSEYRIDEVSLAKGDVSVVNYGANPATSVALREQPAVSAEFRGLSSLDLARLIEPDHVAATRRRLARNP
jgi:HK97 family phage prohead protease